MKRSFNMRQGQVTLSLEGEEVLALVNAAMKEEVNFQRIEAKSPTFYKVKIDPVDAVRMRSLARSYNVRMKILSKEGWPFALHWLKKQPGFLAGPFFFFFILYMLSNIVWNVDIEGASPEVEHMIEQWMQEEHITPGTSHTELPPLDVLQKEVVSAVDGVTWVGVRLQGTRLKLQVVEQTLPDEADEKNEQHIVSTKRAVVREMYVEQGTAVKEPGDFVQPGEVLISGILNPPEPGEESSDNTPPQSVAAEGEVLGEVWYEADVTFTPGPDLSLLSGEREVAYQMNAFGLTLPIWGNQASEAFTEPVVRANTHSWRIFGYELPLQTKSITYYEQSQQTAELPDDAMEITAVELTSHELKKELPEDAEVTGEKILHRRDENGKVKISLHYQVMQNIAEDAPMIQGD
ncbi:hypothetical protein B0H94_10728 [Salsuginibacillus halophilus]|uniref:Stage IV sporulation protein n=1 Tax=Salsuginibacillus halophilus TaxID=517424 RepID=A0A2P8HFQ8_9BACI|nr:sporulation protein YqfD [Salsuginibacillus halophilus]PSL45023.1 hypothetical protein B0H94_10728 [Salsuginibacillus halophilus]